MACAIQLSLLVLITDQYVDILLPIVLYIIWYIIHHMVEVFLQG